MWDRQASRYRYYSRCEGMIRWLKAFLSSFLISRVPALKLESAARIVDPREIYCRTEKKEGRIKTRQGHCESKGRSVRTQRGKKAVMNGMHLHKL